MFIVSKINPTSLGVIKNLKEHKELFYVLKSDLLSFFNKMQDVSGNNNFFIPTTDNDNLLLVNNYVQLKASCLTSLPAKEGLDIALDKFALYQALADKKINTPFTIHLNENIPEIKNDIFPCILKPSFSGDWKSSEAMRVLGDKKAIILNSGENFAYWFNKASSVTTNLILQEIIEQKDDENYSFCGYAGEKGDVLWGFLTQKILQYPEGFGTALLCKTIDHDELCNFGKNIIKSLGIEGIFEVEIIRNRKDNQLYVIEINIRHWSQHRLSTRLGVNITLLDYYYRTGNYNQVDTILSNKKNNPKKIIWIDDIGYMIHCVKHFFHPEKCRFSELIGKKLEFSTFSIRDLKPFLKALKSKFI